MHKTIGYKKKYTRYDEKNEIRRKSKKYLGQFLTGKTAIITGGGRAVLSDGSCGSIGYGIATAYAKEGANLVLTGRNVKMPPAGHYGDVEKEIGAVLCS